MVAQAEWHLQRSVGALFEAAVHHWGHRVAVRRREGPNRWQVWSWTELLEQTDRVAAGLLWLGVEPGERVAVVSNTRVEWSTVDYAVLSLGCVSVPIYHLVHPRRLVGIVNQSRAETLVIEDGPAWAFIRERRGRLRHVKSVILLDGRSDEPGVVDFQELLRQGDKVRFRQSNMVSELRARVAPDDLASIMYTSGTTGRPKGACLSHRNILASIESFADRFEATADDIAVLFLPLGNAYARMGQFLALRLGYTLAYARRVDNLDQVLGEVNPTFLFAVPRIYERAHDRVLQGFRQMPAMHRRLVRTGIDALEAQWRRGESIGLGRQAAVFYAQRAVLEPLRRAFGARIRFLVSGAAPLNGRVNRLMRLAGAPIVQGWGMTETMATGTFQTLEEAGESTVGSPLRGVEVRVAADGEIWVRGDNVFLGYENDKKATEEVFDDEGWYRSGDVGRTDERGHLILTDRKRDIIISSSGKRVAPQQVEGLLRHSPWVREAWVFGEGRPFIVALIHPAMSSLREWLESELADGEVRGWTDEALCEHPAVLDRISAEVDAANEELARYEAVRSFALLAQPPRIETNALTPNLVARRRTIERRHMKLIDGLYSVGAFAPGAELHAAPQ
jgi:long-chain acyl-CoA synthetase